MGEGHRDRAVVLGGSMAGLLAARALAEAYTEVVLLDRDDLEAANGHRRGVPQARHIHALLARGQQVLEELFPGLTAELAAHGVPVGDMLGDQRPCFSGHWLQQTATGLVTVSASRACLEGAVRAGLRSLPGVVFAPPCDVVGLVSSPDRRLVTGVRLLRRKDGSAEEALDADLVVDAMGRGSRTPMWLEALGFARPAEDRVVADVGYATRRYRLATDALRGDLACLQAPTPAHPRGGALARLEGGQSMLTLMGLRGDHPPTDAEGFLAFARSLQYPDIHEAIRDAEPLDEAVAYRFPASVRRRYERLARFPDGLVVLGDSVCSFNPIYGQGMTVAALEALALRRHLERHPTPQPRRFLRDLARLLDAPWDMAAGADLVFPGVTGRRTRRLRLASAYIARLHAAAARDPYLATAFVRVSGLVDPPDTLIRPRVVARVLRHSARTRGEHHPSGHASVADMPYAGSAHDRGPATSIREGAGMMTWGTKGEASIHIAARPNRVHELVSDVTRMGEWSPETYRCTWVDADGPAVGARFRAHNRRGPFRWSNTPQVIAADPGREFAFRRTAPAAGEVIWRYHMEPDASGTMLTESYEVVRPAAATLTWLIGVLSRMLLHITDRDADLADGMRTTLARIKQEAERVPDPTRASRSSS